VLQIVRAIVKAAKGPSAAVKAVHVNKRCWARNARHDDFSASSAASLAVVLTTAFSSTEIILGRRSQVLAESAGQAVAAFSSGSHITIHPNSFGDAGGATGTTPAGPLPGYLKPGFYSVVELALCGF
jgi:hypothetical protein